MKFTGSLLLFVLTMTAQERLTYPPSRVSDHKDSLHGRVVADPYRWLEDGNSEETRQWIESQNALTMPYLRSLPGRDAIRSRVQQLWNYERYTRVTRSGGRYFWLHNNGLQDRSVLFTSDELKEAGRVLIDPNQFASKTRTVAYFVPSPDGNTVLLGMQEAGSDWRELLFMDVKTGSMLPDRVQWVKFSSPSWSEDGAGVYYSRYAEPDAARSLQDLNTEQKVYFHKMGTPQSEDKLVYFRADRPDQGYDALETEDRRYLVLEVTKGTDEHTAYLYRPVAAEKWVELLPNFDAIYRFVGSEKSTFYFVTTNKAPNGRVVAIDVNRPQPEHWREIVPESKDTLTKGSLYGKLLVLNYMHDGYSRVLTFELTGKPAGEVRLPGIGRVVGFDGRQDDPEAFFTFQSYMSPPTVYRFDLKRRESSVFREPRVSFNSERYETNVVFYASKDGTRVPMFLTHRRGLVKDGSHPVYQYGYGGFNNPVTIAYAPSWAAWLDMGGVLAFPAIRGGGEYGREWHLAGTKAKKQNVFDDFIAASEFLIREKYTSARKIAIAGGSNGGLLVAACLIQRPDLFGAAVPNVGVLDMLRFHKFTIGWAWTSDYGSPDNPEDFGTLVAYSPYHNVKKGVVYPPTLITTADHDDRVVPAHSFKFAAALQAAQEGKAPILIRVQTQSGHGEGKPVSMIIEEQADVLAFIAKHLGVTPKFDTP